MKISLRNQSYARSYRKGSQANIKAPVTRAKLRHTSRAHSGPLADCRSDEIGREACACNDCFDKLCAIAEVMGTPYPKVGAEQ